MLRVGNVGLMFVLQYTCVLVAHMSYSVNSLKGGYIGDYIGDCLHGLLMGILGVWVLNYSSYARERADQIPAFDCSTDGGSDHRGCFKKGHGISNLQACVEAVGARARSPAASTCG